MRSILTATISSTTDNAFAGRRFLVTGGAGFIGSHLTERLLALGAQVVVLDDLSSGRVENLPSHHPRLDIRTESVSQARPAVLDDAMRGVSQVVHLASPIGVGRAHRDPRGTANRILDSGVAAIDACRRNATPLLVSSSSEVYGPGGPVPVDESVVARLGPEPRWGYAAAKLELERLTLGIAGDGITPWVVRFFNVVGARQSVVSGHVVPSFCQRAVANEDLVVHGDGSAGRTFLHVEDAADALLHVMISPSLVARPVNVGGDAHWSVLDLAHLVIGRARSQSGIVHVDEHDAFGPDFGRVHDRRPDTTLLRACTGWAPSRSVENAIDDRLAEARATLGVVTGDN